MLLVEADDHRITRVFHPEAGRVFHGMYGSAPVVESEEIGYQTSDGVRHDL